VVEAASDEAALVRATVKAPGVVLPEDVPPEDVPPKDTLSQDTAGVIAADHDRTVATSVDCTVTVSLGGNAAAPAARVRERLPAEMIRSAANGRTVIEKVAEPVSPVESVARTVNWDVPAVVGVPEIAPPEVRVRPGGRALPESANV
jgi:hypothetical protein